MFICIKSSKRLLFSLFFFLFVANLSGQTPNASYISSLPPDLRGDFLEEISKSYKNEPDKVFNAPDTSVKKLQAELEDLLFKVTELERKTNQYNEIKELRPFGENFFDSFQSTFMPINEPNFAADYVVDYGDTLRVQLYGKNNDLFSVVVRRDGAVLLPTLGKIDVAGLSLDKVSELIQARVENVQLGTQGFVSLTSMRDINVLVIGNIVAPGLYTISGGSNVLSALKAAGGISENGSYRDIAIKRGNQIIANIDLYDMLIKGEFNFNRLRSGDSIIVNSNLGKVSLSGSVAKPAIYEIKGSETLKDIIGYGGGILPGYGISIDQFRYVNGKFQTIKVDVDQVGNTNLNHGDSFRVSAYSPTSKPQNKIQITGEVLNPGVFNVDDNTTLKDLLLLAGGYTQNAYSEGGRLIRESAKDAERLTNDRMYSDMIKFIASSPNAKSIVSGGNSALPLILSELKDIKPTGRITAEFDIRKLNGNPSLDTILVNGDKIHIPKFTQEVYVLGEVLTPGARLYNSEFSTKDYINSSGGLNEFGDKTKIVVINPNGDSYLYQSNFLTKGEDILPGSLIYVPREIGKLDGINLASVVAPIFSSLAISLASLNSISD